MWPSGAVVLQTEDLVLFAFVFVSCWSIVTGCEVCGQIGLECCRHRNCI